jgi:hypothetical protein
MLRFGMAAAPFKSTAKPVGNAPASASTKAQAPTVSPTPTAPPPILPGAIEPGPGKHTQNWSPFKMPREQQEPFSPPTPNWRPGAPAAKAGGGSGGPTF